MLTAVTMGTNVIPSAEELRVSSPALVIYAIIKIPQETEHLGFQALKPFSDSFFETLTAFKKYAD